MSYHKINEPFEERGKVYVAKEYIENPCDLCVFGKSLGDEDADSCRCKKCEPRLREDGLNVIFVEVKE